MEVDITLQNECVFRNIQDNCNTSKNMKQQSSLQLRKVLFNEAVNKEKMDFTTEFIVILINGSIVLIARVHTHQEKRLLFSLKSTKEGENSKETTNRNNLHRYRYACFL